MSRFSHKYVGDRTVRELLRRSSCPVPFHTVRTRFLGEIANPRLSRPSLQPIMDLWGGKPPVIDNLEEANELIHGLLSLWNDLTRHQSRARPFRLVRLSVEPTTNDLLRFCRTRIEELEGFVRGLCGDGETIEAPASAAKALDGLAEATALLRGVIDLIQRKPQEFENETEVAVTVKRLRQLTQVAEKEIHEVVLSCFRARQLLRPTVADHNATVH